ncbi:MAG: bifunctional precorrin-2 dehydrogenase/sirohydrochlorin ferrochelatase [Acidobacteria bacterium]|nr:bifunctional precorrin-2 dehydrogenase/sirohydrochlorin ferrochelatase [Acidobacteriota bacterium]
MKYYPIYLDLQGRLAVVIGGGKIAQGKVEQLLQAGAVVRLVSPELTAPLRELATAGKFEYRRANFSPEALEGALLVISATDSQTVNEAVAHAAAERRVLCNVVDQPALCNFITPAVVARGALQISISTGGDSPSLAQRVKREVADLIGEEYGELLEIAADLRRQVHRSMHEYERRRELLRAFIESEALDLLRQGRREQAEDLAHQLLAEALAQADDSPNF